MASGWNIKVLSSSGRFAIAGDNLYYRDGSSMWLAIGIAGALSLSLSSIDVVQTLVDRYYPTCPAGSTLSMTDYNSAGVRSLVCNSPSTAPPPVTPSPVPSVPSVPGLPPPPPNAMKPVSNY